MVKNNLIENIKFLMQQRGINTCDLAKGCTVPQPTINRALNNVSKNPRPDTIKKIANYFNLSISDITNNLINDNPVSKIRLLKWSEIKDFSNAKIDKENARYIFSNMVSGDIFAIDNTQTGVRSLGKFYPSYLIFDNNFKLKDNGAYLIHLVKHNEFVLREVFINSDGLYATPCIINDLVKSVFKLSKNDKIIASLKQIISNFD